MLIYMIGPVTGKPDLNREVFEDAKERLRDAGYDVMIPHDVVLPGATHPVAMRLSIKTMLGCDGVAMLTDWVESQGATLENRVARACGLTLHFVDEWLRIAGDCTEDDDSPEEAANLPSDGARTPSDEVLGAREVRE